MPLPALLKLDNVFYRVRNQLLRMVEILPKGHEGLRQMDPDTIDRVLRKHTRTTRPIRVAWKTYLPVK